MLKKTFLKALPLFAILLFASCKDNSTDPVIDTREEFGFSLMTNVKNSAIYYDLNTESEVILPDIVVKKVTTPYSSYPEFTIFKENIGIDNIKIVMTDLSNLNDLNNTNYKNYTLQYDTTLGKNWYNYNPTTHTLSPKPNVYLLKNAQGNIVKFKISNYINNKLTFVYSVLYQDSTNFSRLDSITVDGSNSLTYFAFQKSILDNKNNFNWDIKFTTIGVQTPFGVMKYPGIVLNNVKNVKATYIDNEDYKTIKVNQYLGQLKSDADTSYAIGINCFKYDENTHRLSPYDKRVFIVKSYSGNLFKLKMMNYYSKINGKSGYITFTYEKQ